MACCCCFLNTISCIPVFNCPFYHFVVIPFSYVKISEQSIDVHRGVGRCPAKTRHRAMLAQIELAHSNPARTKFLSFVY